VGRPTQSLIEVMTNTRDTTIRVAESEKENIVKVREQKFDVHVPLGFVVGQLAKEAKNE